MQGVVEGDLLVRQLVGSLGVEGGPDLQPTSMGSEQKSSTEISGQGARVPVDVS